jgi:nucleoside-diphosphate-sugar epimerase
VYADSGGDWVDAISGAIRPDQPTCTTIEAEAQIARFAVANEGNRGIALRFGSFYGPQSPDSRQAISMAAKGYVMPLGPSDAYKSLIWIDDAADAVISALDKAPSGVFDVTEDRPFTQAEAVGALASATGRRKLRRLPRFLLRLAVDGAIRDLLARSQRVRNARFKQATGWAPQVPDQIEGWRRIAKGLMPQAG